MSDEGEGGKSKHDVSFKKQNRKRRRRDGETKAHVKKWAKTTTPPGKEVTGNVVMSADQLTWKKVSLQNDEFDDFEEIEGVDVEYADKSGSKVIQFKVDIILMNATNPRLSRIPRNPRNQRP
jgi:hypothetical protein